MPKRDPPPVGLHEASLFGVFMEHFDYDSMHLDRKRDLTLVLTMLLACAEGDAINANKLAMLVRRLGGDEPA